MHELNAPQQGLLLRKRSPGKSEGRTRDLARTAVDSSRVRALRLPGLLAVLGHIPFNIHCPEPAFAPVLRVVVTDRAVVKKA